MASDIEKAIKAICEEKGISEEAVMTTIEAALAAAYRKDFAEKNQNIRVKFDASTGTSLVFDVKTVVEDMPEEPEEEEGAEEKAEEKKEETETSVEEETPKRKFNPKTDIELKNALAIKPDAKVDDEIVTKLDVPAAYGRMAAQTAKQVIIQKLREAERDMLFSDFRDKEHTVAIGTVQRRDPRFVLIDIGRLTAVMPKEEQIERENYRTGDRIKVYVLSVSQTNKGPEVIVSRASDEIVRAVFKSEIPEIANGTIEIKAVAREPGSRSKVAVLTNDPNIDPIGSCVGQRGTRVQTIISELGGEKIDIIAYDEDAVRYITHALAPAKISGIELNNEEKIATVNVAEDQLSLAIGRSGQNVRLASKLTGWKITIKSSESGEVIDTSLESEAEKKEESEGPVPENIKKSEEDAPKSPEL